MTTTLPPRSRFPLWAKVTLGVLFAVLLVCGFFVAWLVVALSGGIDDVLSGRVDADDERVVAAREAAERDLAAEAGELPSAGAAVAQSSHDECVVGQHNWKIDEDFDLECTHARGLVLPPDDVDGFREEATALHETLVADGWAADSGSAASGPSAPGIPDVLQEYWDARASFPNPDYGPGDLPSATYVRGSTRLAVTWLAPGSYTSIGYPMRDAAWQTAQGNRTGGELRNVVPAGSYAPVLALGTLYFRE